LATKDHSTRLPAELAARATAARAAATDFRSAVDAYVAGGPAPHWDDHAHMLARHVLILCDELDAVASGDPQAGVAQPGGGWLSGPCVP
jgi:hypothetical protein